MMGSGHEAAQIELMKLTGMSIARMRSTPSDAVWAAFEPENGRFVAPQRSQRLVHMLAEAGIDPIFSGEHFPPQVKPGGLPVEQIFDLFPNLKERLASQGTKLSGGEQQMLAIGRILRTGATLLMLDEPTEGLAPVIIQQIGHTIRKLKAQGFTILLVEQNFRFASTVADRYYVMEHGQIIHSFANSELADNMDKLHELLGV